MADALMSIVPPMQPTLDPWTAPDRLQLVVAPPPPTNTLDIQSTDDQQARRTEALRWLRELTRTAPKI